MLVLVIRRERRRSSEEPAPKELYYGRKKIWELEKESALVAESSSQFAARQINGFNCHRNLTTFNMVKCMLWINNHPISYLMALTYRAFFILFSS